MLSACTLRCKSVFHLYTETRSRTSQWHQNKRKREEAAAAGLDQPPLAKRKHKPHKVHECKKCSQRLSSKCYVSGYTNLANLPNVILVETGHAHYYGSWYCPYVPNPVPVEVWKAKRMVQLQAKKAARQQQ